MLLSARFFVGENTNKGEELNLNLNAMPPGKPGIALAMIYHGPTEYNRNNFKP